MDATESVEVAGVEGLGAERDSVEAGSTHVSEFWDIDSTGIGFGGDFAVLDWRVSLDNGGENGVELGGGEECWGSPAEKDGFCGSTHVRRVLDFCDCGFDGCLDDFAGHSEAVKVAVTAF